MHKPATTAIIDTNTIFIMPFNATSDDVACLLSMNGAFVGWFVMPAWSVMTGRMDELSGVFVGL